MEIHNKAEDGYGLFSYRDYSIFLYNVSADTRLSTQVFVIHRYVIAHAVYGHCCIVSHMLSSCVLITVLVLLRTSICVFMLGTPHGKFWINLTFQPVYFTLHLTVDNPLHIHFNDNCPWRFHCIQQTLYLTPNPPLHSRGKRISLLHLWRELQVSPQPDGAHEEAQWPDALSDLPARTVWCSQYA